jgi:hypothetical protein
MGQPLDDGHLTSDREVLGSIQEVFFDRLVAGRECGSCVACCKILEINKPELQKARHVLCPHNTGTGCGIYETRPAICRTWHCLWRRIEELPDFTRPDRIGVVFSIDRHHPPRVPFEQLYIVARAINGPSDFENPQAKAAIQIFVEEGTLRVWLSFDGNKKLIYPNQDLANAIVNPNSTTPLPLKAIVSTWRILSLRKHRQHLV